MSQPQIGDRVQVKNTLLYNNATGTLLPTGAYDDPWAFKVALDVWQGQRYRIIGVDLSQIEVI